MAIDQTCRACELKEQASVHPERPCGFVDNCVGRRGLGRDAAEPFAKRAYEHLGVGRIAELAERSPRAVGQAHAALRCHVQDLSLPSLQRLRGSPGVRCSVLPLAS